MRGSCGGVAASDSEFEVDKKRFDAATVERRGVGDRAMT
jgi:hypothetical protein